MRSILIGILLMGTLSGLFSQQDSVVVKLTELQKSKFDNLNEQEAKVTEQYKQIMQNLANSKNELIVLIADFEKIKVETIEKVKPEDNSIIFYIKPKENDN
jgi:hypothetical protein